MSLKDHLSHFSTLNAFKNPFFLQFHEVKEFRRDDKTLRKIIKRSLRKEALDNYQFMRVLKIIRTRLKNRTFEKLDPLYSHLLWKLLNSILQFASIDNAEDESTEIQRYLSNIKRKKVSIFKICRKMQKMDLHILELLRDMSIENHDSSLRFSQELLKFIQWSKWHVDDYRHWTEKHFEFLAGSFNRLLKREHINSDIEEEIRLIVLNDILKLISLEIECPFDLLPEDERIIDVVYRKGKHWINGHALNPFGFSTSERVRKFKKIGKKNVFSLNLGDFISLLNEYLLDPTGILNTYCLPVIETSMQSGVASNMIQEHEETLETLFKIASQYKQVGEELTKVLTNVFKWRNMQFYGLKLLTTFVAWPLHHVVWKERSFQRSELEIIVRGYSNFKEPLYSRHEIDKLTKKLGIQVLKSKHKFAFENKSNASDSNVELHEIAIGRKLDSIEVPLPNPGSHYSQTLKVVMTKRLAHLVESFQPEDNQQENMTPSHVNLLNDSFFINQYEKVTKKGDTPAVKIISNNDIEQLFEKNIENSSYQYDETSFTEPSAPVKIGIEDSIFDL